jgi:pyruvate carboxylase
LRRALEEYGVSGIKTNTSLFRSILADPEFVRGKIHTRWLDERLQLPAGAIPQDGDLSGASGAAALAAALWHVQHNGASSLEKPSGAEESVSRWKLHGRSEQLNRTPRRSRE